MARVIQKSMLSQTLDMVQLQECSMDLLEGQGIKMLMLKMADVLQNQFSLKPKMQGQAYTPPFPEWYHRVALPPRVKPPADFTKFSGQDDTSTVEHIARYLMQLGEASADEAFRIRYFPLSLTGPAFTWFASLPAQSICSWKDLE
jgi:hypothetical protein